MGILNYVESTLRVTEVEICKNENTIFYKEIQVVWGPPL